jgi:acetylornithine deacetylase/succinyl-diaminopimelate desuccinylase-like protein
MTDVGKAIEHARAHTGAHLETLKGLLAIPSISTLKAHQPDMTRASEWLVDQLNQLEMNRVEVVPTAVHPVVYGEYRAAPARATVLVYGHYDVQPADPLDEWESGPFEPTVRGDNIYARGAADMKGQLAAFLMACQSLKATGGLPVNLKLLFEGEEEIGSPSLPDFVESRREELASDTVLICDSPIERPDLPALVCSLRGNAYFELEIFGPSKDLHSGVYGGSVHNPLQVLCELVAGMHDDNGRVSLPGFYDDVRALSAHEREGLERVPYSDDEWKETTGVPALWGELGYGTLERVGARPTLEVNGMIGGFTEEGAKTVIPAKALAKISTRLVPNQKSELIREKLEAYLRQNAPDTVRWELRELHHAPASEVSLDSDAMQAATESLEEVFGVAPVFRREGGSVPVVGLLQQKISDNVVLLGFAMPTDGIHGPNEKMHLPNYYRGIETYIRFLARLAERAASS